MSDHSCTLKIVMVGNTRSGKSSLITRSCENEFRTDIRPTTGVDFKYKVIRVGDTNVKLQIWDTSGDERYRGVSQTYYSGVSAIVLVYAVNDRKSFQAIESRLCDIKSYSSNDPKKTENVKNAPYTLIANKIDVIDRIVSEKEGRDFAAANNMQYFQTSAQSGQGVEPCFQHIAEAAVKHNQQPQQSENIKFGEYKVRWNNQPNEANKYYSQFKKEPGVQMVESKSLVAGISILDVQIRSKGPVEDRMYSDFGYYYRETVRIGNTLAKHEGQIYWLRRGLKKFFDIDINIVRGEKKGNKEHLATFGEVENMLSWNNSRESEEDRACVQVYKLLKANGENAQISYFHREHCWVAASKNVCVLARNREDLKQYTEQRYHIARLIAQTWFDILEKNNYSEPQLDVLKYYMSRVTLVGEYYGNPQYQHIVKYTATTIKFYSIVEKESKETCIPPQEAARFFKDFNIPVVNGIDRQPEGCFFEYQKLCDFLVKLFDDVSGGKIEEQQEGCVLYFVMQAPARFYELAMQNKLQERFYIPKQIEPMNVRVSSLAKIKTMEYRIWHKLRKELKRFYAHINQKNNQDLTKEFGTMYVRYEQEMVELVGHCKLQKPLEYFFLVGLRAFNYGVKFAKIEGAFELPLSAYIDFLNIHMHCVERNIEAVPEMTKDKQFIAKLREFDWAQYNLKVHEIYEKALENLLPEYSKIKKLKGSPPTGKKASEEQEQKQ